jgi:hypothetical protein
MRFELRSSAHCAVGSGVDRPLKNPSSSFKHMPVMQIGRLRLIGPPTTQCVVLSGLDSSAAAGTMYNGAHRWSRDSRLQNKAKWIEEDIRWMPFKFQWTKLDKIMRWRRCHTHPPPLHCILVCCFVKALSSHLLTYNEH